MSRQATSDQIVTIIKNLHKNNPSPSKPKELTICDEDVPLDASEIPLGVVWFDSVEEGTFSNAFIDDLYSNASLVELLGPEITILVPGSTTDAREDEDEQFESIGICYSI